MLSCLDGSNSSLTQCHFTLVSPTDADTSLALVCSTRDFTVQLGLFRELTKIFTKSLEGNNKRCLLGLS